MQELSHKHAGWLAGLALLANMIASPGCRGDRSATSIVDVSSTPVFEVRAGITIGAVDDPERALVGPYSIVRTDSLVFVTQWNVPSVRVYSTFDGRFRYSIGQRGRGPGEFGQPGRLGLLGDTLWVEDGLDQSLKLFTRNGGYLDAIRLNRSVPGSVHGTITPRGVMDHTSVWAEPNVSVEALSTDSVVHLPVYRVSWTGEVMGPVVYHQLVGQYARLAIGSAYMSLARNPFAHEDLTTWSPGARAFGIAAVEDRSDAFVFTIVDANGDTSQVRRFAAKAHAVTPDMVHSVLQEFYSSRRLQERGIPFGALERAAQQQMRIPEFEFPVRRVVAGRDGSWWLHLGPTFSKNAEWLILAVDGTAVGRVRVPREFRVLDADRRTLWGVVQDSLGVPYLKELRLLS